MRTLAEYASNRRALWEDERDGGIYGAGAHHVVGTIDLRFRNDSGAHHVGAHHVVGTIELCATWLVNAFAVAMGELGRRLAWEQLDGTTKRFTLLELW